MVQILRFTDGLRPACLAASPGWRGPHASPGLDFQADARALTSRVLKAGAVMATPGTAMAPLLVGHLKWLDHSRVFWFAAHGITHEDGQLFEFDELQLIEDFGVYFLKRGKVLGYLSTIDAAAVDDPDRYRIAWQLWQEVAPLWASFIQQCGVRLAAFRT